MHCTQTVQSDTKWSDIQSNGKERSHHITFYLVISLLNYVQIRAFVSLIIRFDSVAMRLRWVYIMHASVSIELVFRLRERVVVHLNMCVKNEKKKRG